MRVGRVARPKAGTLVAPDEPVRILAPPARYVGRGGVKLEAALRRFGVDPTGREAIDVGASTGGFTDCLLQHGARRVTALDVGYGQLHWRLREDPRVEVVERTNVRHVDPAAIGGPFSLVVADLSFISLRVVAPVLAYLGGADADWILLVKPQFEAGRERVGRGGIVRDPDVWREVIDGVVAAFAALGVGTQGVTPSPIRGARGNREFLLWARRGPGRVGEAQIAAAVAEETP